jgi:hypothetical protein
MEEADPNSSPDTSSTLALAEPPVILRLQCVLAELQGYVGARGNGKQKRMNFVIRRIIDDVVEELHEIPVEHMQAYFDYMGKVVQWIGTGDDEILPDSIREYLQARAGTLPEEKEVRELVGSNQGSGHTDSATGGT